MRLKITKIISNFPEFDEESELWMLHCIINEEEQTIYFTDEDHAWAFIHDHENKGGYLEIDWGEDV